MDDVKQIVATNLALLMEMSADLRTQTALAKRAEVAQTTIGNYLRPDSYVGLPHLDKLQRIARCFNLDAWHLLHPTLGQPELTAKELAVAAKVRKALLTRP